jgi:recombination protein RecA
MANKKKTDTDIFSELAKDTGGAILADEPPVRYFIDTANLAVNYICSKKFIGGGLPGGRIIELLGPSSGGKSLWGMHVCRGVQSIDGIPVYLDTENALNPDFARDVCHINPKNLVRFTPARGIDCLERLFLKVHNIIRKVREKDHDKPLAFVYDSIAVSPSERELRETGLSENFTDAEWKKVVGRQEQPGERAKICNKEFRKLESVLEKTDTTMLVINQIRQKIGVVYGNPEVGSTASTVLEFYACVRLRVSAHKKIENTKLKKMIGVNLKVKNIKNRVATPFMEAEDVQLFFDKGVHPLSGLLSVLEKAERIESVGKGTYKVKEPWAEGKDYEFKATKKMNSVEPQVLCDCPALVDAKTADEVREYLAPFSDVMNQTLSEDVAEKEVQEEDLE